MSILKYIMSPFVDFKEEGSELIKKLTTEKVEHVNVAPKQDAAPVQVSPQISQGTASAGSAAPVEQADYQKHFETLIEEANANQPMFQGTDFKEFIDSKIDVEAIADEETRYKTAFNVLKRTGLTKERLISTGQEYINLVERDLKGFNDAYTQQYKTEVEQKEELLQKKTAELKALNEKIEAITNDIKQMSQDITDNRDKLNSNKNSFILAGESKKTELKAELQKIDKYFS